MDAPAASAPPAGRHHHQGVPGASETTTTDATSNSSPVSGETPSPLSSATADVGLDPPQAAIPAVPAAAAAAAAGAGGPQDNSTATAAQVLTRLVVPADAIRTSTVPLQQQSIELLAGATKELQLFNLYATRRLVENQAKYKAATHALAGIKTDLDMAYARIMRLRRKLAQHAPEALQQAVVEMGPLVDTADGDRDVAEEGEDVE
ncbi:hypothetical protein GGF31_002117 [Allomyces arbusculus]|nr:hypothetical protein GGF31_002117 [Allomyces arbusculus]